MFLAADSDAGGVGGAVPLLFLFRLQGRTRRFDSGAALQGRSEISFFPPTLCYLQISLLSR